MSHEENKPVGIHLQIINAEDNSGKIPLGIIDEQDMSMKTELHYLFKTEPQSHAKQINNC